MSNKNEKIQVIVKRYNHLFKTCAAIISSHFYYISARMLRRLRELLKYFDNDNIVHV